MHRGDHRCERIGLTGLGVHLAREREVDEVEAPLTRAHDVPVEDAGHPAVLREEVPVVEVAVHDRSLRQREARTLLERSPQRVVEPVGERLQLGEGSPGHFARELLPRSVLTRVDVVAARQRDQLLGVPDREHLRDPSREHRLQ